MYMMRIIFTLLTFLSPLSAVSQDSGGGSPHLILYFDINKTLIASDKAGNKAVEDVLNELLAEKFTDRWDETLREAMTFYAYVDDVLAPGSQDDSELIALRKFYRYHFIDYLEQRNHPLYRVVLQEYQAALAVLEQSESIVFPSFYHLISTLDQKGISYSIILRSFGEEVFEVKDDIEAFYDMTFERTGTFRAGKLYLDGGEMIEEPYAVYRFLRRIEHTAIHDDWSFWNTNKMSTKQGKPFYIDRGDADTLSIFFDDNIRENGAIYNIIAPLDAITGEVIPIEELVESGQAVRVETLEAILNPNYYVNRVEEAMAN